MCVNLVLSLRHVLTSKAVFFFSFWGQPFQTFLDNCRYGAAEWAVGAIFEIASRPVAEFGAFLRAQSIQLFGESTSVSGGGIVTARLSHFLFLLGQFAVKIVVLAEELATEVKRRRRAFQKRPKIAAEGATEEEEQKRIEEEMGLNASREKPEDEVRTHTHAHARVVYNTFCAASVSFDFAVHWWVLYDVSRSSSVSRIRASRLQILLSELSLLR